MLKETIGYEMEDPGNLKERLRYYCEIARKMQEEKDKANKAERDKED